MKSILLSLLLILPTFVILTMDESGIHPVQPMKWKKAMMTSLLLLTQGSSRTINVDSKCSSSSPCLLERSEVYQPAISHDLQKKSIIPKPFISKPKKSAPSAIERFDPSFIIFEMLKGHLNIQDLRNIRSVNKGFNDALRPLFELKRVCKASKIYPSLVLTSEVLDDYCLDLVKQIKKLTSLPDFTSIIVSDWRIAPLLPVDELVIKNVKFLRDHDYHGEINSALRNSLKGRLGKLTIDLGFDREFHAGNFFTHALKGCVIDKISFKNLPFNLDTLGGLSRYMARSAALETLEISAMKLNNGYWRYLDRAVIGSPNLKSFTYEFGDVALASNEIVALTEILAHNQLETFEMKLKGSFYKHRNINERDLLDLNDFGTNGLSLATNLKHLSLFLPLETNNFESLGPALSNLNQLESLTIGAVSLHPRMSSEILAGLSSYKPSLKSLKILSVGYGDDIALAEDFYEPDFARHLESVLVNLPELEILELRVARLDVMLRYLTNYMTLNPECKIKSLKIETIDYRIQRLHDETVNGLNEIILPRLDHFSLSGAIFPVDQVYRLKSLELMLDPMDSQFWTKWKSLSRSAVEATELEVLKVKFFGISDNMAFLTHVNNDFPLVKSMAWYLKDSRALGLAILDGFVFTKNPKSGKFAPDALVKSQRTKGFRGQRNRKWYTSFVEDVKATLPCLFLMGLSLAMINLFWDPCISFSGARYRHCEEEEAASESKKVDEALASAPKI